jgi:hypothetical protein
MRAGQSCWSRSGGTDVARVQDRTRPISIHTVHTSTQCHSDDSPFLAAILTFTLKSLRTPDHLSKPLTMPQPPLALKKYLSTPLPTVRENFPAGGGATGERKEYDTKLKGVSIVEDFNDKVVACTSRFEFVGSFDEFS